MELPNPRKPEGGCFHKVVEYDVKLGTIVAYLIDANDHDLNHKNPLLE